MLIFVIEFSHGFTFVLYILLSITGLIANGAVAFKEHTNDSHWHLGAKYAKIPSKSAHEASIKKEGMCFTQLPRLPYFNLVHGIVIDPMHNLIQVDGLPHDCSSLYFYCTFEADWLSLQDLSSHTSIVFGFNARYSALTMSCRSCIKSLRRYAFTYFDAYSTCGIPCFQGCTNINGGEYASEPDMDSGDEVTPTAQKKARVDLVVTDGFLILRILGTSWSLSLSSTHFLLIHSNFKFFVNLIYCARTGIHVTHTSRCRVLKQNGELSVTVLSLAGTLADGLHWQGLGMTMGFWTSAQSRV